MQTPEVIRSNRVRLRLTQAELARDIGVDVRQINRYETGTTEPTLAIARRLAERLRISMDELAGDPAMLNGVWWSAWQGLGSQDQILLGVVELAQTGRHLTVQPDRAHPEPQDLSWSAEIYVEKDSLLGGYKISTEDHRSMGMLNLTHTGNTIGGDWIKPALSGTRYGKLALATRRDQAVEHVEEQVRSNQT